MDSSSHQPKMGGGSLSIIAVGGSDLTDSLLSSAEGGSKLAQGLTARIRDAFGVAVHLDVPRMAGGGAAGALQTVRAVAAATVVPQNGSDAGAGVESKPDVVVLSLEPRDGGDVEVFSRTMRDLINLVKNELRAHVIVFNASTVDHADLTSNYVGVDDTPALRIHRLNLALMWLSMEQGISIVDVDRLIADIGAGTHVRGVQDYSAEASGLICDELIRVLSDYGFFEQRPLVAQLGRAAGK